MRSSFVTFTVVLAIASVRSTKLDASVCQSAKPCYCQLSESEYIDLRPLSQRLSVTTGELLKKTTYEIQLCSSFTRKKCSNVLGCQEKLINTYAIGSNFNFINTSLVELQNGAEGRLSKITLECGTGTDSNLAFENESPSKTYNFKLISPYACVKTVETTTPSAATNSTTTTTQSSNSTTHSTVPTNTTTASTPASNTTTASTHASNTTTPASNTTTASTHASNTTTVTTPASNTTTASTHASNTTTVTTVPTNSTTAPTSPSTKPTITSTATTKPSTTAPPSTTHKGGACTITSLNAIFLLITGFIISKVSL